MIIDCPGYGYKAQVEWMDNLGSLFSTRSKSIKLALLLIDPSHGIKSNDLEVIKLLDMMKVRYQIVLTKCDRVEKDISTRVLNATEIIIRTTEHCLPFPFPVSVKQNKGLGTLRHSLLSAAGIDTSNWLPIEAALKDGRIKGMYNTLYYDDLAGPVSSKDKSSSSSASQSQEVSDEEDEEYDEEEEEEEDELSQQPPQIKYKIKSRLRSKISEKPKEQVEEFEEHEEEEEEEEPTTKQQKSTGEVLAEKKKQQADALEDPEDFGSSEEDLQKQIEELRNKVEELKMKSWNKINKN